MAYMKDSTGRRLDDFQVAPLSATAGAVDLAILGDSLANYGEGLAAYIEILSGGRYRFSDPEGGAQRVYSYPGDTSATILANVDDVTSLAIKPAACIVQAGTNDAIASRAVSLIIADIEATCDALEAVGVRPIMSTIPPLGGSFAHSAIRQPARRVNIAIRRSAKLHNRQLIENYTPMVEPTTGSFLAAYDSGDNVHPNTAGLKLWAQIIVDTLSANTYAYASMERVNDGNSLIGAVRLATGNGNFGGSPNAGLSADLGVTTALTGFTPSLVASDIAGVNWQRITVSGASASLAYYQVATATVTPNDLIQATVRVRMPQNLSGGNKWQLYVRTWTNGGAERGNFSLVGPLGISQIVDGVAHRTFRIPALADRAQFLVLVPPVNGTYDIAQPTIQNLTALGVA